MPAREKLPYEEFIDFLLEKLSPEEIIAFTASPEAQERSRLLVERQSAGQLTADDHSQLQRILDFERVFVYLKARALQAVKTP
jgi:hypothetical protein